MAHDNLLTYPDFNETFKIHTNASTFQLGAVISQNGKPIAFYSRKITGAKRGGPDSPTFWGGDLGFVKRRFPGIWRGYTLV